MTQKSFVAMSLPLCSSCLIGGFGRMFVLIASTTCCLHAVYVLFVGFTSTSDVFKMLEDCLKLLCGIIVAALR